MEDVSNTNWDEKILPFELRVSDVRGRIVRLDETVNGVLAQHNYPKQVESLISEMVIITALLGSMVESLEAVIASSDRWASAYDCDRLFRAHRA